MFHSLVFITLLFLRFSFLYSGAATTHHESEDLVRSSCMHANYPTVCVRTLSSYKGPAKTPRDLAQAAVKVSLGRAERLSRYLSKVVSDGKKEKEKSGSNLERVALSDCVEEITESVDELRRTLSELKHLKEETFSWQMSNVETWVSAALTNEDTCLDGFEGVNGKIKSDLRRKITNVAMVTSNALYMINRLDESNERP